MPRRRGTRSCTNIVMSVTDDDDDDDDDSSCRERRCAQEWCENRVHARVVVNEETNQTRVQRNHRSGEREVDDGFLEEKEHPQREAALSLHKREWWLGASVEVAAAQSVRISDRRQRGEWCVAQQSSKAACTESRLELAEGSTSTGVGARHLCPSVVPV